MTDDPTQVPPTDAPSPPRPKRRLRYRGTHPRRFDEKYKELNPAKYPEAVRKVVESGKTPAGSHRPVMVREVIEVLAPKPGEIAVDATLGHGGHATELLTRILPGGRLIAFDVDPLELPRTEARLRAAGFPETALTVCHSNFAGLPRALAALGVSGVDLVLADLGCSSMQFDNPARGFSFKLEGPLDLRMNPNKGQPASALLTALTREKLAAILEENADEPRAVELAAVIIRAHAQQPITKTSSLTRVVTEALERIMGKVTATAREACVRRVFQALRIAVNEEFTALETFLRFLPDCLNPGGRVAVLTFHSGEDRRVKKAFQEGMKQGAFTDIAWEVTRPSVEELRANPRASSAKLRWAVKAKV